MHTVLIAVGVLFLGLVVFAVIMVSRARRRARERMQGPPEERRAELPQVGDASGPITDNHLIPGQIQAVRTFDLIIKVLTLLIPATLILFLFLLIQVLCKNILAGIVLGFITSAFVGVVCFMILTNCALQNFIYTRMDEATAKMVFRLGQFSKVMILFRGHVMLTSEQADALNRVTDREKGYPYECSESDIIQLKRLNDAQQAAVAVSQPQYPWYIRWVNTVFNLLGGLQVIGIPGIDELHVWSHQEHRVEEVSEGERKRLKETVGPVEEREYLRLNDMPLRFLLVDLETSPGYSGQQGIAPSMDLELIIFVRVVNVYLASIMVRQWRDGLAGIAVPFVREIVAETMPTELTRLRTLISQRVLKALHGYDTEWGYDEDRTKVTGIKHETRPETERQDTALGQVLTRYGLEILRVEIGSINPSDPKQAEAFNEPFNAQLAANAEILRAGGEAGRLRQVMDQITRNPELARTLLTTDAVKTAKGTTFLTVGASGGSVPNDQTQLLQAILAELRSRSGKPAEAGKAGEAST